MSDIDPYIYVAFSYFKGRSNIDLELPGFCTRDAQSAQDEKMQSDISQRQSNIPLKPDALSSVNFGAVTTPGPWMTNSRHISMSMSPILATASPTPTSMSSSPHGDMDNQGSYFMSAQPQNVGGGAAINPVLMTYPANNASTSIQPQLWPNLATLGLSFPVAAEQLAEMSNLQLYGTGTGSFHEVIDSREENWDILQGRWG